MFAVERRGKSWRLADVSDERVVAVDLTDGAATKNLVQSLAPQTVFDCVAYGAYSFETDASLIYETNFNSVVRLARSLAAGPFAAYVHAGSSSEYGTNCTAPREDAQCVPNSDYAMSKLAATEFLRYMGKTHNFPCATLRLYSVYGPLEDTSRLMPNVVRSALAGTLPPFVDRDTSRDFVHVDDVCRAFILCAAKMHPGMYGEIFNVGSGRKTTIGDLAQLVRETFGVVDEPRLRRDARARLGPCGMVLRSDQGRNGARVVAGNVPRGGPAVDGGLDAAR